MIQNSKKRLSSMATKNENKTVQHNNVKIHCDFDNSTWSPGKHLARILTSSYDDMAT
jgi:hypothetical protein